MTEILNEKNWKMTRLVIDWRTYGEFQKQYIATVTFENSESEGFTFRLSPEETMQYIQLLKGKMVENAGQLGTRILQSFKMLTAPEEKKEIGSVIEPI
jgi:hypothetical protein